MKTGGKTYFSNGQALESRPWSLSKVTELFWALINFIVLFFRSLIDPTLSSKGSRYSTDYHHSGRPADRGRRIGRVRGDGGSSGSPSSPPMAGGG